MKYAQYLDGIVANPIGQDAGKIGYDEFSCARNASRAPQSGLIPQHERAVSQMENEFCSSFGTILRDVCCFMVKVQ